MSPTTTVYAIFKKKESLDGKYAPKYSFIYSTFWMKMPLARLYFNRIMMEAADMAIKHEYERLLTDEKITPVIEPKVNLVKCDEEELEVKFEFVVEPKIELGKYTNLGIKMDKVKVTKEEVENRIKSTAF